MGVIYIKCGLAAGTLQPCVARSKIARIIFFACAVQNTKLLTLKSLGTPLKLLECQQKCIFNSYLQTIFVSLSGLISLNIYFGYTCLT